MEKPTTKGHNILLLVDYGELILESKRIGAKPELKCFAVDSITDPCIAYPYTTTDSIIDAKTWLFMRPKEDWYDILIEHLEEYVGIQKRTAKR